MRNMMIDEVILDDLQYIGFPNLISTDEVYADIMEGKYVAF